MKTIILILSIIACTFTLQAQQIKPDVVNSMGGSAQNATVSLSYSVGEPVIGTASGSSATLTQGFLQTWKAMVQGHIALKLFLEGLYAGNSAMNQAQDLGAPKFDAGIADKVTVELHNPASPYAIAYTFSDIDLHTDGTVDISNLPGNISGSYYMVIKHRNSIETWSSAPVDFTINPQGNYDFSTSASQAYGNNLKHIGSIYAIFGGNANQDAIVDGSDMALIDNASTAVQVGYYPEDLNGDGITDASDMAIIDNNSTAVVHVMKP